jgi:PGF-CTERM protein
MGRGLVWFVAVVLLASATIPAGSVAAQDQVTLTVSVISQGGAQLGGVTITATWDGGETTATTASNGKAFVDVPRGADVDLTISSDRFVLNSPVTVEDAASEELTIEVARKGSAVVSAISPAGPVRAASVALVQNGQTVAAGETDADGTFTTDIIEQGRYTLEVRKPGYYTNRTTIDVLSERSAHEVPMRTGTVRIEVRVEDDHFEDPRPVDNATVEFGDIGTVRTTGGTAVFAVPVNTQHRIEVTKPEYDSERRRILVGESSNGVRLTIQREPAVVVQPANRQVVVGESTVITVVDAYGETIADAEVRLDGDVVARTDDSGEVRVGIESSGNHTVSASAGGIDSEGVIVAGVPVGGATPTASTTPTAVATASPTATPMPTTTAVSLPGFGPLVAVLGVVLAALLLSRRD